MGVKTIYSLLTHRAEIVIPSQNMTSTSIPRRILHCGSPLGFGTSRNNWIQCLIPPNMNAQLGFPHTCLRISYNAPQIELIACPFDAGFQPGAILRRRYPLDDVTSNDFGDFQTAPHQGSRFKDNRLISDTSSEFRRNWLNCRIPSNIFSIRP